MSLVSEASFLYERVASELGAQIHDGIYAVGEKLPSIRQLCAQKHISVASAMQAMSLLEARGMVEARPKSGYFVRRRILDSSPQPEPSRATLKPHLVGVSDIISQVSRQLGDNSDSIPLGAGVPSPDLLPVDRISRYLAQATREDPKELGRYGPVTGHPEYLRQLAKRFALVGCQIPTDEIVATIGAMDALNLAIRAVTQPGDTVAVESPCYFGILEILESLGLKALPVPSTCEEGIDLGLLADAIERHPIKAVVLVPTFSNPNGSCMTEASRRALLELLSDHDLPLVEDDLYGDLHFDGARIRPVKSFDSEGRVLYCGSFSKCLSPGLRVGWIAAGRYAEEVKRLKFITTTTTPVVTQLAAVRYFESGAMDRHLRAIRSALHTQTTQIAECVLQYFPQGTAISRPKGGYFLWVQLPEDVDALTLHQLALEAGIHIMPGQVFCSHAEIRNRIRLSCGYPCDTRIQNGIKQLGQFVRRLQKQALRVD